jgi:hypothetical protein
MRIPVDLSPTLQLVSHWHAGRASLDGPDISVSGRQILLGTLRS